MSIVTRRLRDLCLWVSHGFSVWLERQWGVAPSPHLSCEFPCWLMTQAIASLRDFTLRRWWRFWSLWLIYFSSYFPSFFPFGISSPSLDSELLRLLFIFQPDFSLEIMKKKVSSFRRVFLSLNDKRKIINTVSKLANIITIRITMLMINRTSRL